MKPISLQHPFSLLRPFCDHLDVFLLTKEDHIQTDADVQRSTGYECSASIHQVHGNHSIIARQPMERSKDADGLITDQSHLLLTIRTADCQPILVYCPKKNIVGLLHVGWKGLIARAIPTFFRAFEMKLGCNPQEAIICIGPSMRQCCAEYREQNHPLRIFDKKFWNANFIDLAGIANQQMQDIGITSKQIERHPDCTCCHSEQYWTYRGGDKERVQKGYTNVLAATLRS